MSRRVEFIVDASGAVTGIRRAEQMTDFTKLRAVLVARRLDEIKRLARAAESDMAGFITTLDHLAATQAAIEALDAVER